MKASILALKHYLLEEMTHFMLFGGAADENDPDYEPDFDAGYTAEHVARCGKIIDQYLKQLETANADPQAIMNAVKTAVLDLNTLNESCEHCLIETEQREQLYELISMAAGDTGLEIDEAQDLTEEWREW